MNHALIIGKKIKRLRQAFELTQAEFAERVGSHQVHVSNWEGGRSLVSTPFLLKIYVVFKISLSFFDLENFEEKELFHARADYQRSKISCS